MASNIAFTGVGAVGMGTLRVADATAPAEHPVFVAHADRAAWAAFGAHAPAAITPRKRRAATAIAASVEGTT